MSEHDHDPLAQITWGTGPSVPATLLAMAQSEAQVLRTRRRRRLRQRGLLLFLGLAALLAVSLTPPGRAAAGWVGRLVGLEQPTLDQRGATPGSAAVIATGRLSNGDHYEVVLKKVDAESFARGATQGRAESKALRDRFSSAFPPEGALCFQVDWPSVNVGGVGGQCIDGANARDALEPLSGGVFPEPRPGDTDAGQSLLATDPNRPAVFLATTKHPDAWALRVVRVDRDGTRTALPAQLLEPAAISGGQPRGPGAVKVAVSALPAEVVAFAGKGAIDVEAELLDGGGNRIARRDLFPMTSEEIARLRGCIERGPPLSRSCAQLFARQRDVADN